MSHLVPLNLNILDFNVYSAQVNALPMLSHEEENNLFIELNEKNNIEAAHKLVISHLRLVASMVKRYLNFGIPAQDLVQEGTIGLMKAVKHFKPNKGARLNTFALLWIKYSIQTYIVNNFSLIKDKAIKKAKNILFGFKSFNEKWEESSVENQLSYCVSIDEHEIDIEDDRCLLNEKENKLDKLMDSLLLLDDRSRYIIESRYLLDQPKTLSDLSNELDISIERVRQIEKRSFDQLKLQLKD